MTAVCPAPVDSSWAGWASQQVETPAGGSAGAVVRLLWEVASPVPPPLLLRGPGPSPGAFLLVRKSLPGFPLFVWPRCGGQGWVLGASEPRVSA